MTAVVLWGARRDYAGGTLIRLIVGSPAECRAEWRWRRDVHGGWVDLQVRPLGASPVFTTRPPCPHGDAGFCFDAATAAQRAAHDQLHRHAYAWAEPAGRDRAERYAAAFAGAYYDEDEDDVPGHSRDLLDRLAPE